MFGIIYQSFQYKQTCETDQNAVDMFNKGEIKGFIKGGILQIPCGVEVIEQQCLFDSPYVNQINEINIPDSVRVIGIQAFTGFKIKQLEIPGSVEIIGNDAFSYCENLETVKMGSGVKNIKINSFSGCNNLKSVTLSSSLETIGQGAFSACYSLNKIDIPKSVTKIERNAFMGPSFDCVHIGNKKCKIDQEAFNTGYTNPSQFSSSYCTEPQCIDGEKIKDNECVGQNSQGSGLSTGAIVGIIIAVIIVVVVAITATVIIMKKKKGSQNTQGQKMQGNKTVAAQRQ